MEISRSGWKFRHLKRFVCLKIWPRLPEDYEKKAEEYEKTYAVEEANNDVSKENSTISAKANVINMNHDNGTADSFHCYTKA